MKSIYWICMSMVLLGACKKDSENDSKSSVPTLITTPESQVTATSVQSGGTISSDGGSNILARGICWSEFDSQPTIDDSITRDGSGTGTFISVIQNLEPYAAYYVRAYATNEHGTGYGNVLVILTAPGITLSTTDITVTNYIRSCETFVTLHGSGSPDALPVTETGVCWSTHSNPTIADSKVSNGPISDIYKRFTNRLQFGINSTYYIRGYATTAAGTTYGNTVTYATGIDIGLSHGGGIIYYVDNTGRHGLIAAINDQGANIPWAPESLFTVFTNASSTYDGASNTTNIINTYGNSSVYAAKLCRDYRGGGFTDWYLPAYDEINAMKLYQDAIGGFPPSEFLTNNYHWCSTEYDYFRAWDHDFNLRYGLIDANEKRAAASVRAIRKF